MALDPEEFRKRRALREQQRNAEQAKRKKMMLRLGIAAAILIVCAVVIIIAARPDKAPAQPPATTSGTAPAATEPEEESTVIHIAAAGDLNVNDAVLAAGGRSFDYTDAFLDVAHLLGDADLTLLNYEGVACGEPYGDSKSAPLGLLQALSRAGVDLIQLANSYSIYKGVSGLATTIDAVRAAGMEPVGAYKDNQEAAQGKGYTLCSVRGVKIAVVAFTKGMDGMALPAGSEKCVNLLYSDYASTYQHVNEEGITAILSDIRAEKPDLTIAMLHWGSEYNDTISASQHAIRRLLQNNGVDVIIGTHSHYVQEMELDQDDNTFVAYSLGDFFGDAQRAGTEYSVVLDLEITKDNETGRTTISDYSYTPVFTVAEEGKPLRVVRIKEAMRGFEGAYIDRITQETYDAMAYALTRIDARVQGQ